EIRQHLYRRIWKRRGEPLALVLRLREDQRRVADAEVEEQPLQLQVRREPRGRVRLDAGVARDAPDHLATMAPRVERRDARMPGADELKNGVGAFSRQRAIEPHDVEERAVAPQAVAIRE